MHFLWIKYKLNSDKYKFFNNCDLNFVKKLQIVLINLNVNCNLFSSNYSYRTISNIDKQKLTTIIKMD